MKSELSTGLKSWSEVVKRNTTQVQNSLVTSTKKSVKQVVEKVNEEKVSQPDDLWTTGT